MICVTPAKFTVLSPVPVTWIVLPEPFVEREVKSLAEPKITVSTPLESETVTVPAASGANATNTLVTTAGASHAAMERRRIRRETRSNFEDSSRQETKRRDK